MSERRAPRDEGAGGTRGWGAGRYAVLLVPLSLCLAIPVDHGEALDLLHLAAATSVVVLAWLLTGCFRGQRWPGWLWTPLVAWTVLWGAPAIEIALVQLRQGNLKAPLGGALSYAVVVAPFTWPFPLVFLAALALYRRKRLDVTTLKYVTVSTVSFMFLPSTFIMLGSADEFTSSAPDAGQGTGVMLAVEQVVMPLAGTVGAVIGLLLRLVVGWFARRSTDERAPSPDGGEARSR